ncbi:MAG: MBL fold metallo-hydrolase [Candidatus Marsarchaeota archaeon]
MKITYLGHSCFVLESNNHKMIIDPYQGGAFEGFGFNLNDFPDALKGIEGVAITHHHADHDYVEPFKGAKVFDGVKNIGKGKQEFIPGFTISSYRTDHGPGRGDCSALLIEAEGKKIAHLGDTYSLPADTSLALTGVDFLMIPVGGRFTVGPEEASQLSRSLSPAHVIPMHYAVKGKSSLVPYSLDDFLKVSSGLSVLVMKVGSTREI